MYKTISTMEMRIRLCDTVFFLDLDVEVCLNGIRSRRGKKREDMPWIEDVNEPDEEFENFVIEYNQKSKPSVMALLKKYADKKIIIFHKFN